MSMFSSTLCRGACLLCLLTLTACGGSDNIRHTLGLERNAPDEFKVVSRPPLSLPPDYALRPPRAGEQGHNAIPAAQKARAAATGQQSYQQLTTATANSPTAVRAVSSHALASDGERSLLSKIGAEHAAPNIREALYQDHQTLKDEQEESWLGSLTGKKDEALVDAAAEAERIREKQQAGETVTGEDVRTRDHKARSVIDQIF